MWGPVRLASCLAAVFVLAFATDSVAATKVDLTEYLDGFPQIGDFRVFNRNDGASLRSEIIDLIEHKKSTELFLEFTEDGDAWWEVQEIVHGKETRLGSVSFGDVARVVAHSKRIQSFRMVPGKPQKFTIRSKVFFRGERVGSATLASKRTFVGFESIDTPFGPFDQVVHLRRESTFTEKVGGSVYRTVSTSNLWITREIGTVRSDNVSQSSQDGVPFETFGPFQYTFDHSRYRGVDFP